MVRLSGECRSITAPENLSRKTPLHLKLSAPEYEGLSPLLKDQLNSVPDEYCYQNLRIQEYNRILSEMAHQHPLCQILLSIPGIGPINATAIYSAICNGAQFNSGYQLFYSPGVTCSSSAANRWFKCRKTVSTAPNAFNEGNHSFIRVLSFSNWLGSINSFK